MHRYHPDKVIVMDYSQRRHWLIDFIEGLEGGDYDHFIDSIGEEMNQNFKHVEIRSVGRFASWYVGELS